MPALFFMRLEWTPRRQCSRCSVHNEVASTFDQYRHRHRLQLAIVFKGLELIELKDSMSPSLEATIADPRTLKFMTYLCHANEPALNRFAIHRENARRLPAGYLGAQGLRQVVMQKRDAISVVALERLSAERPSTSKTQEPLNPSAVALAVVFPKSLVSK